MKKLLLLSAMIVIGLQSYSQWLPQATGFSQPSRGLNYIHAVDANVVWAAAYDGLAPTVYIQEFTRTVNGGTLWTPGVIPAAGCGIAMIFALNANTAWAPMFSPTGTHTTQGIYKTTDGGANWVKQASATFNPSLGAFPNVIHFFNANEGYCQGDAVGGYFEIYVTSNGGTTWTRVPSASIPAPLAGEWGVVGYYDAIGDITWFGTNKGRVYKSVDKGNNWTVAQTPLANKFIKPVFANELYGIVQDVSAATTGTIAKTEDGGATWTTVTHTGPLYYNDITYVPGTSSTFISTGAATGFEGASYSFNGGNTWANFEGSAGTQYLATDFVNNSTGWAGGFSTSPTADGVFKYVGTLTPGDPEISVSPESMMAVLEPDVLSAEALSISNIGEDDLTFGIEIEFLVKKNQKPEFHFRDLGFAYGNTANEETDAAALPREVENTREMWDLQFVHDVQTSSTLPSHAGSETDGSFIYTALWNGPSINKFAIDGTFIETFTIPGVTGIRDLAFDGEFFYGSNATAATGIWKMDFVNKTLVSTIPYTGAVRAIAYDEVADGFWVNNWTTALTLVSRTGTILQVGPITPSCYGIAYDVYSPGGPYMWLFTGTTTGGGCQVEQITMPGGTLTGVSHSVSGDLGTQHIAGGLWIYPDLLEGTVTLGGCAQGEPNKVFGYEIMAITPPPDGWLYTDIITGTVGAGQTLDVMVTFDATGLDYGEYEAVIEISSNDPGNPTVYVPALLIVSDYLPPAIIVDPMTLTQAIAPNQVESQEMIIGNEGEGELNYLIGIEYAEGTNPEEIILEQGFEGATFPPAGWLKLSPDGGTGWTSLAAGTTPIPGWQGGVADPAPDGGTKMAFCTWETGGATSNNQWLVTPQVNVSGETYLAFWMRYWPNTFIDKVEIKLSTTVQNNVNAYNIMVAELNFNTSSSIDWEYYEFNLADFVPQGTNVYIGFRETVADNLNDGAVIFLDNVMVYQTLSWLSVSPDEGLVQPMDEDIISVTFNSAGLDIGVYEATLFIVSNDPDIMIIEVPVTLDVITGINEPGEPNAVMVYPNPAAEFVRVQANHNIREIKIFNSTGQLVISKMVGDKSININTSGLTPGMYHLQIESEAGTSNQKVMIR